LAKRVNPASLWPRASTARRRQQEHGRRNSRLDRTALDKLPWHAEAAEILEAAMRRTVLTARGWHRARKVAATIADLEESPVIAGPHVMEAVAYRGQR
jgi:magnesium chelatase family protein